MAAFAGAALVAACRESGSIQDTASGQPDLGIRWPIKPVERFLGS
jgi:hypothetical protein